LIEGKDNLSDSYEWLSIHSLEKIIMTHEQLLAILESIVPDKEHIHDRLEHLGTHDLEILETFLVELTEAFVTVGPKSAKRVAVFGSGRCAPGDQLYIDTYDVVDRLIKAARTNGIEIEVVTGGGPCVMSAALESASINDSSTVGLNIRLPREEKPNTFQRKSVLFTKFMGLRKYVFLRDADALIFMEGGFGTADEAFEALCLVQTGLLPAIPMYFVGKEYWGYMHQWAVEAMLAKGYISPEDLELMPIVGVDDPFVEELVTKLASA
jgi:uncharacterized protein (TIGR00730 family)